MRYDYLTMQQTPSGPRHFIGATPIHAGDDIEILINERDQTWLTVRYEWTFQPGMPPRLYTHFGVIIPKADLPCRV